ncbi:MAG: ATP-grasp domain-containing protein [Candidatus Lokiarchaeota archaeon]|nr:ATP-grasp domain-containing protein [Candidatus Lokiarchaeota archaeon]MBD3198793.1 ATP-grasp domain-containing protein [Candidatus Lokiarchaeota archaeon]
MEMSNCIFICEFVSGGGFNKEQIPVSLFCEGFSMLRAICTDLKKIGFKIITLLDERISFLHELLPIDNFIICSKNSEYVKLFKESISKSDYCYIIAPEFSNILLELTKLVIKAGKKLLNVNPKAIELATSKFSTYKYFLANELSTPKTYIVPNHDNLPKKAFLIKKLKDLNSPIIVKPEDGVGAEYIFYFETKEDINQFYEDKVNFIEKDRSYILQEYIAGENLSLSLIGIENNKKSNIHPFILSFNAQNIRLTKNHNSSEYLGGYTPVDEDIDLSKIIRRDLKSMDLTNFVGYFGIDLISTNSYPMYIEINPRLTTSYLGIRNILKLNPAELILKSVTGEMHVDDLENNIQKNKTSVFKRLDLKYKGSSSQLEINERIISPLLERFPEFITPPITFESNSNYSCFIATNEKTLRESNNKILSIKRELEEMDFIIL